MNNNTNVYCGNCVKQYDCSKHMFLYSNIKSPICSEFLKIDKQLDYTGETCVNCGRNRVVLFESGKRICEKCLVNQNTKDYELDEQYRLFHF